MERTLYPSIEAMLAPEVLSTLAGQPLLSVQTFPLVAAYNKSGSRLLLVETNGGQGPRFILKRVSLDWDWQMRATGDYHCRAVALWQQGIFDRLPPEIEPGVVACARDGRDWAILMKDFRSVLMPYDLLGVADNAVILEAMAALHATFFELPDLTDPALNLCRLEHVYTVFGPQTGRREVGRPDEVPSRIREGWELIQTEVEPDVAKITLDLVDNPESLCRALARYPHTLVHGDWRHANQGLLREEQPVQTVLLDWQLATVAPPGVELGRYLGTNSALLPISKEAAIEYYRRRLAARLGDRFDESWWRPQLELSLLGGFVQDGWAIVLKATRWHITDHQREHWQADLRWWSERVRAGAKWL